MPERPSQTGTHPDTADRPAGPVPASGDADATVPTTGATSQADTTAAPTATGGAGDAETAVAQPTTGEAVAEPRTPAGSRSAASGEQATEYFASSSATTQVLTAVRPADQPTDRLAAPPPGPPDGTAQAGSGSPWWKRRAVLAGGGVLAALALLYGGDLALASGSVPRGVTVAGVPVGGMSPADAEQTLRREIEPRTTRPVPVTVGSATSEIDPKAAGLAVDWAATLRRAGAQPLNPITRLTSFFTTRELGVATTTDAAALDGALTELKPIVDKPAVEGTVRFEGTTPQAVDPVPGQQLDVPAAARALTDRWVDGGTVALPLTAVPPATSADEVRTALESVATPAVAAPVTVAGEQNTRGTLSPELIAKALTFTPGEGGGLKPVLNTAAVTDALKPQLKGSEKPGRDATLDFATGAPVVVPSQDGRGVDYEATLKDLLTVLAQPAPRQITAVYADQPAKVTTEGLTKLGISGVIGEFTTGGFASDSGQNIKRAADQINGTVVAPGKTFSLNAVTNPRDAAHGYVEAGIIEDGHPARGIGGGVSQVATTLYNASYFAGMVNVEHKEHSFYISRYPAGREATVFDDVIDLKFRNDNPTAVMIRTVWTPKSLTVQILGTKIYDVTSQTGPRTNPTEPKTVTLPAGDACKPSKGAPGFTVTDTRTLKEIGTGQTRSETRTVRYNPSPIVVCGQ